MVEPEGLPCKEEIERRKQEIKDTLCCPHCGERMNKWLVPQTMFTTWPNEFMYICFNDQCAYFIRSQESMAQLGNAGSYRLMYDPLTDSCQPVPVLNRQALKDGIVEEAADGGATEVTANAVNVKKEDIVGTWKLVSFEERSEDGAVSRPSGAAPVGFLVYTEDGHVSVQNQTSDGSLRVTVVPAFGGNAHIKEGALEALGAYSGRYEIKSGGKIVHHIDVSLYPAWVGLRQERTITVEGNRLTLISPRLIEGDKVVRAHMTWERAG